MAETFGNRLLRVTRECRDDMHEPDEQNLTAVVTGYLLDNAMGDDPRDNCGELTVGLVNISDPSNPRYEWFNLADLIALARVGAELKSSSLQHVRSIMLGLEG